MTTFPATLGQPQQVELSVRLQRGVLIGPTAKKGYIIVNFAKSTAAGPGGQRDSRPVCWPAAQERRQAGTGRRAPAAEEAAAASSLDAASYLM
jgi:hypothetical protein